VDPRRFFRIRTMPRSKPSPRVREPRRCSRHKTRTSLDNGRNERMSVTRPFIRMFEAMTAPHAMASSVPMKGRPETALWRRRFRAPLISLSGGG